MVDIWDVFRKSFIQIFKEVDESGRSLFVTMKFVQKLAISSFADVSWNFLWLVPTIMFDEVPAAVDIRIDVGVTGRDSLL